MLLKRIILLLTPFFLFSTDINIKAFKADFIQTVFDNQNKLNYQGKIYIKNNNSLWEYTSPNSKKIYIKDKEVFILDDDLEQVIIAKNNLDLNKILSQAKKINDDLYVTSYANVTYFLTFNKDILDTIEYKDELENTVTIQFKNQTKNETLVDDKIFNFSIPSDYDIIRQ